ncbi:hypothetical protein E4U53_001838, partial [Claviceps sorghi]
STLQKPFTYRTQNSNQRVTGSRWWSTSPAGQLVARRASRPDTRRPTPDARHPKRPHVHPSCRCLRPPSGDPGQPSLAAFCCLPCERPICTTSHPHHPSSPSPSWRQGLPLSP